MDNITHTLIGALVGEAAAARRTTRTSPNDVQGRNLLVWISAIGSNFPDCDLLYTAVAHDKLSYVLQHRGYTHTVLGAIIAGVLLFCCALICARSRKWTLSVGDRWRIAAMSFFTPLLHVGMDFTNNYGVHPFWPWYDGWFYGDSIFIIEPLLWAACASLAITLRSVAGRLLVRIVLVAAVVLPIATSLVPLPAVILIASISGGLLWIAHSKPRAAIVSGIGCWLGVTAAFAFGHSQAALIVERIGREQFSDERFEDAILTPLPANPLCWETLFVQVHDHQLTLRRAMLAVAPSIIDASHCPTRGLDRAITAPLTQVKAATSAQIKWYGETRSDVNVLRELERDNCYAARFMQFARAPWFAIVDGKRVLGDLRFDREPQLGFAEIDVLSRNACGHPAPWLPPRTDVLGNPGQ